VRGAGNAVGILVALALVAAACGTGGANGQAKGRTAIILAATEHTNSARFQLTISFGGKMGTADGQIDFAHHTGRIVPRKPDPDAPTGEERWFGATNYWRVIHADSDVPAGTSWEKMNADRVLRAMHCRARALGPAQLVLGTRGATAEATPNDVLEALRASGAPLSRVGSESVRGVATTHWRIIEPYRNPLAGCRIPKTGITVRAASLDVWTDAHNVVRRTRQSITFTIDLSTLLPPGSSLTTVKTKPEAIHIVTTADLFDFGAPVDITAPQAHVYDETPLAVVLFSGPGKAKSWRDVADGTFQRIEWRLWSATTSTGWRCYETKDAKSFSEAAGLGNILGDMPEHDGRTATCLPANTNGLTTVTLLVAGRDGARWKLAGVVFGPVKRASIGFDDGSSVRLPFDRKTGVFQWSGPAAAAPRMIRTDATTCGLRDQSASPCEGLGETVGPDLPQLQLPSTISVP
jgi:hypothetical protein